MEVFAIAVGGALGALSRYGLGVAVNKLFYSKLPLGTLLVNIIGAFIIGFLWALFTEIDFPKHFKNFALVGFVGSFTTFSTLSLDTIKLINQGHTKLATFYIIATNLIGLLMVLAGYFTYYKAKRLAVAYLN